MEFCPWVKPGTDDEEMLAGIFMIANDLEEAPRTRLLITPAKIMQANAMKACFQIAERSLFYAKV